MEPEFSCTVGAALLACSQANANVTTLLSRTRLFLAPVRQVGMLERKIQYSRIVSAIVDVAGRYLIWELIGLDKVTATQFYTIDTQLLGSSINQPL